MYSLLVVDDEEKIRTIIRKYGEFEGYKITEVSNGIEAIEVCKKQDFDLIILDIMMPARGMKQDANSNEERHADIENTDKYDKLANMPNENESESIIKVRVVETQSGETYVIFLNSVITQVGATVHTLRVQLIYISGIMILLSLLIAFIISKRVSKSIIRVNDSDKELAKGNFEVEFDGKDYREIT